jgi:hypothetical protein
MATKKQRRRREKEQRHEYVWVDDEGNELARDELPVETKTKGSRAPATRAGREPSAPSWSKSLKRGLIFAPIMLATVMLLSNDLTFSQQLSQALFIAAVFIPFSYFLDRVMYRSFQKRLAKSREPRGKPGS